MGPGLTSDRGPKSRQSVPASRKSQRRFHPGWFRLIGDGARDAGRMKGQGGQLFNKGHFFNKYIFPTYTFV